MHPTSVAISSLFDVFRLVETFIHSLILVICFHGKGFEIWFGKQQSASKAQQEPVIKNQLESVLVVAMCPDMSVTALAGS